MLFDVNRVRANARQATTEDLLDRVTVCRKEMEPAAVAVIEEELHRRGVTPEQVQAHGERAASQAIRLADGRVARCELCDRPAVMEQEGWQRLLGLVPLYRRTFYYCAQHRPPPTPARSASEGKSPR